jgi:hypothetical protein
METDDMTNNRKELKKIEDVDDAQRPRIIRPRQEDSSLFRGWGPRLL